MAKFCMYCGRPLAEGEVCNCQNNANTQETAPQTTDTNTQANAPAAEANAQPDNTNAQAQTAAQNDYNQGANPNQNFNQGGPIPNQNFNQGFNQNYNGNQGMPYGAAPQQAHSSELGNKIKFVFFKNCRYVQVTICNNKRIYSKR